MSGIWGWFGGGAAQKRKDTPKNVILDLRTNLEMLQKREAHILRQIEEQEKEARKHVNTNKTAAKNALRRKKVYEGNLEQTMNHIGTLETQINAIESANINKETFEAMQRASEAMKSIHGKLTPEKVDEAMYVPKVWFLFLCDGTDGGYREKLQEHNQLNEEIAAAIGSVNIGQSIDDGELDAELDELMAKDLEDKMLETGTVHADRLPSVATGELKNNKGKAPAVEDDEEAELNRLKAEMAM
ncbi:ESCRT-III subunit protein snf7 [Podospora pseudopauciseta]|uniref:Vacuolar-sorting protein SNF7 n=2 Tax=Podospora TaxID=5144 RepID=A0ABR0HN57_9PEZI|nr:ESCRT-III subunit protein snf7 [Podospora pseudopauciseta]KAK4679244.1 ESCRT-III subunit protein snf7 [Podospora pseudoanserina]